MIDIALLHSKIAAAPLEYLHELYGDEVKRAGTDQWRVGKRGSLAIRIRDNVLVYFSHEEGKGGDAIALWQRERGGSMGEAIKAAASWAQVADDKTPQPGWGAKSRDMRRRPEPPRRLEPPPEPPPRMTNDEFHQTVPQIRRLAEDPGLCERIATARGWKPETIQGLALDCMLGWSDGWPGRHGGALTFLYDSGIKHRWEQGEERMVRWFCGGPRTFWRGSMNLPSIKTVLIAEGETDAISFINSGVEEGLHTLVVAVPNAGVIPHGLSELVTGRKVILSLDRDKAGQAATEKLIPLIKPIAADFAIWTPPQ